MRICRTCRLPGILLLALIMVLTTAVSVGFAAEEQRKMIFITHDMHPFFIPTIVGMNDACDAFGWECQFVGPPSFSVEGTANRLWSAIQSKPDAIATVFSDPAAYNEAVATAREQGIAVVGYNTDNEWRKEQGLPYVGQQQFSAGIQNGIQAVTHGRELTGKETGKIVIVTCCPGHTALEERIAGTKEGIEQVSDFDVEVLNGGDDATRYVSRVEAKWLAERDEIVAFVGVDGYTENLARFVETHNLKGKVAAGGWDLLDTTLQGIKNGSLQWTIGQDPYSQGFMPVVIAWITVERGYPGRDYDTGAEIVDASNVDDVIARESLWKEQRSSLGF